VQRHLLLAISVFVVALTLLSPFSTPAQVAKASPAPTPSSPEAAGEKSSPGLNFPNTVPLANWMAPELFEKYTPGFKIDPSLLDLVKDPDVVKLDVIIQYRPEQEIWALLPDGVRIKQDFWGLIPFVAAELPADMALLEALANSPGIVAVYQDIHVRSKPLFTEISPAPTGVAQMARPPSPWIYLMNETLRDIHATDVWDRGYTGIGIVVALLDTGIAKDFPNFYFPEDFPLAEWRLKNKVIDEVSFVPYEDPYDYNGQGTAVAHVIASTGRTGGRIYYYDMDADGMRYAYASPESAKGVAPGCFLMNVKCMDEDMDFYNSWVMAALVYALYRGADIIACSWLYSWDYTILNWEALYPVFYTIEWCVQNGAVVVFPAGNEGPGYGTIATPGNVESVLTVGAATETGLVAPWSARGPTTGRGARGLPFPTTGPAGALRVKPEIVAPGDMVLSAHYNWREDGYFFTTYTGTGMSYAHAVGAVALLIDAFPGIRPTSVKIALMQGATKLIDPFTGEYYDYNAMGMGLLNVLGAYEYLEDTAPAGKDSEIGSPTLSKSPREPPWQYWTPYFENVSILVEDRITDTSGFANYIRELTQRGVQVDYASSVLPRPAIGEYYEEYYYARSGYGYGWIHIYGPAEAEMMSVHFSVIYLYYYGRIAIYDENYEIKQTPYRTYRPYQRVFYDIWSSLVEGNEIHIHYYMSSYWSSYFYIDRYAWVKGLGEMDIAPVESPHPYRNNMDEWYVIDVPGVYAFSIHFEMIDIERYWDTLYIYDENMHLVTYYQRAYDYPPYYYGPIYDVWSPMIFGSRAYLRLVTDSSVTYWGFRADKVRVYAPKSFGKVYTNVIDLTVEYEDTSTVAAPTVVWGPYRIHEDAMYRVRLHFAMINLDCGDWIRVYNATHEWLFGGNATDMWTDWFVGEDIYIEVISNDTDTKAKAGFVVDVFECTYYRTSKDLLKHYSGYYLLNAKYLEVVLPKAKVHEETISPPIETPHPYDPNMDGWWVITQPGAAEIRLFFDYIEVEGSVWDYIEIYDADFNLVQTIGPEGYHVVYDDYWTNWVSGDTVYVHFVSDWWVEYWGFVITKYQWREFAAEPLPEPVESDHPYPDNADVWYAVSKPGVVALTAYFDNITLAEGDYVEVYSEDMTLLVRYDGPMAAKGIWTPWGTGDTLYVHLVSDEEENAWGFNITHIRYKATYDPDIISIDDILGYVHEYGGHVLIEGEDIGMIPNIDYYGTPYGYNYYTMPFGVEWRDVCMGGPSKNIRAHAITRGVGSLFFGMPYSSLVVNETVASVVAYDPYFPAIAVYENETSGGAVVVIADNDVLDDDYLYAADNFRLGLNIMAWFGGWDTGVFDELKVLARHAVGFGASYPLWVYNNTAFSINVTAANFGNYTENVLIILEPYDDLTFVEPGKVSRRTEVIEPAPRDVITAHLSAAEYEYRLESDHPYSGYSYWRLDMSTHGLMRRFHFVNITLEEGDVLGIYDYATGFEWVWTENATDLWSPWFPDGVQLLYIWDSDMDGKTAWGFWIDKYETGIETPHPYPETQWVDLVVESDHPYPENWDYWMGWWGTFYDVPPIYTGGAPIRLHFENITLEEWDWLCIVDNNTGDPVVPWIEENYTDYWTDWIYPNETGWVDLVIVIWPDWDGKTAWGFKMDGYKVAVSGSEYMVGLEDPHAVWETTFYNPMPGQAVRFHVADLTLDEGDKLVVLDWIVPGRYYIPYTFDANMTDEWIGWFTGVYQTFRLITDEDGKSLYGLRIDAYELGMLNVIALNATIEPGESWSGGFTLKIISGKFINYGNFTIRCLWNVTSEVMPYLPYDWYFYEVESFYGEIGVTAKDKRIGKDPNVSMVLPPEVTSYQSPVLAASPGDVKMVNLTLITSVDTRKARMTVSGPLADLDMASFWVVTYNPLTGEFVIAYLGTDVTFDLEDVSEIFNFSAVPEYRWMLAWSVEPVLMNTGHGYAFLVINIPIDVEPGTYEGTIEVKDEVGNTLLTVPLYINVVSPYAGRVLYDDLDMYMSPEPGDYQIPPDWLYEVHPFPRYLWCNYFDFWRYVTERKFDFDSLSIVKAVLQHVYWEGTVEWPLGSGRTIDSYPPAERVRVYYEFLDWFFSQYNAILEPAHYSLYWTNVIFSREIEVEEDQYAENVRVVYTVERAIRVAMKAGAGLLVMAEEGHREWVWAGVPLAYADDTIVVERTNQLLELVGADIRVGRELAPGVWEGDPVWCLNVTKWWMLRTDPENNVYHPIVRGVSHFTMAAWELAGLMQILETHTFLFVGAPHFSWLYEYTPSATLWRTVETPHPYGPNMDEWYVVPVYRGPFIRLHFDRLELAEGDKIEVYNDTMHLVWTVEGPVSEQSVWSPWLMGTTAHIHFVSDEAGEAYGFRVDAAQYGTRSRTTIESPHPYPPNSHFVWKIEHPGAYKIRVHLAQYGIEPGYDALYFYDKDWNMIYWVEGSGYDRWTEWIPGDTVYIVLYSDSMVQYYGVTIDAYEYCTADGAYAVAWAYDYDREIFRPVIAVDEYLPDYPGSTVVVIGDHAQFTNWFFSHYIPVRTAAGYIKWCRWDTGDLAVGLLAYATGFYRRLIGAASSLRDRLEDAKAEFETAEALNEEYGASAASEILDHYERALLYLDEAFELARDAAKETATGLREDYEGAHDGVADYINAVAGYGLDVSAALDLLMRSEMKKGEGDTFMDLYEASGGDENATAAVLLLNATAAYKEAIDLLNSARDTAEGIARDEAEAQITRATSMFEEAKAQPNAPEDKLSEAEAKLSEAEAAFYAGDYLTAIDRAREAYNLAKEAKDLGVKAEQEARQRTTYVAVGAGVAAAAAIAGGAYIWRRRA